MKRLTWHQKFNLGFLISALEALSLLWLLQSNSVIPQKNATAAPSFLCGNYSLLASTIVPIDNLFQEEHIFDVPKEIEWTSHWIYWHSQPSFSWETEANSFLSQGWAALRSYKENNCYYNQTSATSKMEPFPIRCNYCDKELHISATRGLVNINGYSTSPFCWLTGLVNQRKYWESQIPNYRSSISNFS